MKKPSLFFTTVLSSLLVWTSCQSEDAADVNQERIETNYHLVYDASEDETIASASFTFGSTFLKLNSPSEVLFEEDRLRETEILGIVDYRKAYNGEVLSGTFAYTNNEGNTYENTITITDRIDLPASITELSISEGGVIEWIGGAVQSGETVSFHLTNDAHFFVESVSAVNATSLVVRANAIQPELLGQCSMRIERAHKQNLEEAPDAGGNGYGQYFSEEYVVMVTE